MRLRGLIVLTALCAALGVPHASPAAPPTPLFLPCGGNGLECSTVNVPLDRSGATPGTVSLHVEELPAPGKPRGVLFFVAGGPGQGSAGTFQLGANAIEWRDQFSGYTLVAFDNRGTGKSGVLRCPELQADPFASGARAQALTAKCAAEIGPSRAFYSTRDHADDIDAVRQALGVDKIALWGTSYGTQLSVTYALTYPSHVERLILDSVADATGRDPFALDDLKQIPKGLASLCSGGLCKAATSNFVGEVVKLANRLAVHPLAGKVAKPGGGTKTVRANGIDFLSGAVIDSDLNAGLASELPAAVHAALHGRSRALLRLVQLDRESSITPAEDLSMGMFTATVCDDGPFPWDPDTPLAQRPAKLAAARSALPGGSTGPFGLWATDLGPAAFCLRWPPQARCPRSPLLVNPIGTFPASFTSLGSRVRARTLAAVSKTVREAAASWAFALTGFSGTHSIAGLYGGVIRTSGTTFTLKRYSLVPGVQLNGTLRLYRPDSGSAVPARFVGSMRILGPKAAQGRLSLGPSRLTGRLGGRRVRGPA